MRERFGASFAIRHGEIPLLSIVLNGLSKQSCRGFNMQNQNSAWCDIEDTRCIRRRWHEGDQRVSGDGGRQIGDQPEKHFPDFGVSRPLSGLSALLGMAQILGGFRTHGAASVDVHSGNLTHAGVAASLSPTLCLGSATLCQIGTLLVTFGGQCCISATALRTCGVLYDFNEGSDQPATRLQRGYDLIGLSAPTMLIQNEGENARFCDQSSPTDPGAPMIPAVNVHERRVSTYRPTTS